jgi:hypothetical protein
MTRRLESRRVAPGSFISGGPDAYAAIELAISELFGITLDRLITSSVFTIDDDGRITASPRIEASGGMGGLRILSADDNAEYILSITDSGTPRYLEIYKRTDGSTEAAPVYELVNKMALSGDDVGKWENQVASFLDLSDAPSAWPVYQALLRANDTLDGLEFVPPGTTAAKINTSSPVIASGGDLSGFSSTAYGGDLLARESTSTLRAFPGLQRFELLGTFAHFMNEGLLAGLAVSVSGTFSLLDITGGGTVLSPRTAPPGLVTGMIFLSGFIEVPPSETSGAVFKINFPTKPPEALGLEFMSARSHLVR